MKGTYVIATQTIKNGLLDIPVFKGPWLHCYLEFLHKLQASAMDHLSSFLSSPMSSLSSLSHPKFMLTSYEE